ncbi:uncharacterized protein HGUI_02759 [Hanseniaspora guilliermondii]|uniref:DAGKc domain-containing protein n=1 Tax=Hanseniaspora guilliermondii TaxID=56406 RepID=A0A1L0D0B0_9ASCO|nr:uncharacterized protein HGUI_02759 [Hanseniaspora guilliermondii]
MSNKITFNGVEFYQDESDIKWKNSTLPNSIGNHYDDYDKILVVNSTKAGKQTDEHAMLKDHYSKLYFKFLNLCNEKCKLITIEHSGDIQQIAHTQLLSNGGKKFLVVILSGDTSIKELIEGADTLDILLDILHVPFGTANALFWDLFQVDKNTDIKSENYVSFNDILQRQFLQFVKGTELKGKDIPLYTIRSTKTSERVLAICFLLITTGFHATLLKVASEPAYATLGDERFLKASNDLAGDKYHYNNYIEIINKSNHDDVIFAKQESSYFGIFNQGRLERGYDISPMSDFTHRYILSIKEEEGKKQEFFNKILKGYDPDTNALIKMYNDDPLVVYKEVDTNVDLLMRIYPNTKENICFEKNVCIDGHLVPEDDILKDGYLELSIEKIGNNNIKFFGI